MKKKKNIDILVKISIWKNLSNYESKIELEKQFKDLLQTLNSDNQKQLNVSEINDWSSPLLPTIKDSKSLK